MEYPLDAARADDAGKRQIDVAKRPAELVLQQGGDGEDALLVVEDGRDDARDREGDGVVGRALLGDDLVGRVPDLGVQLV